MRTKNFFLTLLLTAMIFVPAHLGAQVTIGEAAPPQSFSILELISNQGGLRLPQLTRVERNAMMETDAFQDEKMGKAVGLTIFNTCNRCVETWNGERWVRSRNCPCGAYVAPGVWRQFMCHNLGADTSLDPFTPHPGLHGAMFKWGTGIQALSGSQNNTQSPNLIGTPDWAGRGGTPPPTTNTAHWNMVTANPCPPGFRVPTIAEWEGVIANNPVRRVGNWTANNNPSPQGNFSSGTHFGDALFLPAAGNRRSNDGLQQVRGSEGFYWSSTSSGTSGYRLQILSTGSAVGASASRNFGMSMRCIAQ